MMKIWIFIGYLNPSILVPKESNTFNTMGCLIRIRDFVPQFTMIESHCYIFIWYFHTGIYVTLMNLQSLKKNSLWNINKCWLRLTCIYLSHSCLFWAKFKHFLSNTSKRKKYFGWIQLYNIIISTKIEIAKQN